MANYGGIEVETPQEVLARIRTAQQKALLNARSPEQINQINITRALDLAFGNPEVEQARKKTAALSNALQEAKDVASSEGLDEDNRRLLELTNLRDALIDLDPEQALAVTKEIQAQKVYALEKEKLQQSVQSGRMALADRNKRYVLNPDTLQSEELDISTVEGAQRLLEARRRGEATADKEGSLLNLYNAERARQHDREQAELLARSKKELKALEESDATSGLGKTTATALKKSLMAVRQPMDQMERAAKLINDPRFQSISGKITSFKSSVADLLSRGILNEDEAKWYQEVIKVRANISNAVGEFRHERFGGALTEPEIKKGKEYLPDESDTPEQFLSKTEELYRMFKVGMERASLALDSNDWHVLKRPGTEFWNEEEDRLFDPQFRQQYGTEFRGSRPQDLTVQGPSGGRNNPPGKSRTTAQDILNRYKR